MRRETPFPMKSFARGQKSKLSDVPLGSDFQVGIHLEPPGNASVDISCFGLDAADKLSDDRYFIFYNQRKSPEGEVAASGPGGGAQENFTVSLGRLPATIKKLVFTATLDGAATMAQTKGGWLRLIGAGGAVAGEFLLVPGDYQAEKAIIVAELYLKDAWRFAAVGQGFNGGLSALLRHFGGEETAAAPPPPPPAAVVPPPPPKAAAPAPALSLKKVTLEKQGEKRTLSLAKTGGRVQPIHINLNWDRETKKSFFGGGGGGADLDLGCMYTLRNGDKGVIQALGGNFGSKTGEPFIFLDKDDRSGASSDGENLSILRPDLIQRVLIFAFIYDGTANFSNVNGRLTLKEADGSETLIRLNSPDSRSNFCAIGLIQSTGEGVEITKEERYFPGHAKASTHYQFGFTWTRGSK